MSKPKSLFKILLIPTVFLITLYLYVSPYITLLFFREALYSQDRKSLKSFINFQSVRNSLKIQLSKKLNQRLFKKSYIAPIHTIGMLITKPLVNSIVDNTITPKGLLFLLDTGQLSRPNQHRSTNSKITNLSSRNQSSNNYGYVGINKFILDSKSSNEIGSIRTLWQRTNIFHWRLVEVIIPEDIQIFHVD